MVRPLSFDELIPATTLRSIAWAMSDRRNASDLDRLLREAVDRFDGIISQHQATQHWSAERVHREALSAASGLLDVAMGYVQRRHRAAS